MHWLSAHHMPNSVPGAKDTDTQGTALPLRNSPITGRRGKGNIMKMQCEKCNESVHQLFWGGEVYAPALSFTGEAGRAGYFSKSRRSKTKARNCIMCRKFRAAWGERMSFSGGRQRGCGRAQSPMCGECHTTNLGFIQRGAVDRFKARRGREHVSALERSTGR